MHLVNVFYFEVYHNFKVTLNMLEEEVLFIKSITLGSPWTELRVLLQFIKIFKLYILQD